MAGIERDAGPRWFGRRTNGGGQRGSGGPGSLSIWKRPWRRQAAGRTVDPVGGPLTAVATRARTDAEEASPRSDVRL